MSTKTSLKYHSEEAPGGGWFHLYRDCFDEEDEFVYLELGGVPFESSTSVDLSGNGLSCVAVRLPNAWALKLGLVGGSPAAGPAAPGEESDERSSDK